MKKLTKTQLITLVLLLLYVIWEIRVQIWARDQPDGDPIIRADLLFIIPLLLVFIAISMYQYFKGK